MDWEARRKEIKRVFEQREELFFTAIEKQTEFTGLGRLLAPPSGESTLTDYDKGFADGFAEAKRTVNEWLVKPDREC